MQASSPVRVLVFAKAPVPGEVKTRLSGVLGADGAAALYRRMLRRTVAVATAARIGPVELCCAPTPADAEFEALRARYRVELSPQCGADLGARMWCAAAAGLTKATAVLLIGADCPALTAGYLRDAGSCLMDGADAVIGPAEDGGYVLLGLKRIASALFSEIPWGGPCVLAETSERLRALGWSYVQLPTLWDVDRPEDLARISHHRW